jgi:predicted ATPase/class 3 adenylate cyclase
LNSRVARKLPTGTVTLVFTDVEGSTRLLQQLGADAYADALAEHRRALREAFVRHDGVEVDTQGDSFFIAFSTAPAALAAAAEAQQVLAAGPIRVRMGIHTGTPRVTDEGYVGPDVHRAARIAAAGHGGQILVSSSTASLVEGDSLRDLGEHRLKDLAAPERIYQLGGEAFPPLRSLQRTNLPIPATPFLGRQRELDEVTTLLGSGDVRLLTLTGPAGAGKTRLALQAAAEASDHYPDGVFWAPLAALRDPKLVLEVAAQALEARDGLADRIADRRLLLVLDNFEHLIGAAGELNGLLAACPNLQLLVTSRELLQLPGEQAYPVPPLEPQDATELFTARARAADPRFEPGPIVEQLCSRLDNLPLALELAATRVAVLSPEQLLDRLSKRLELLKAGRGVDPRQQTLRATIEWSYDLLDEEERLLFERLSVFRGGCTLEAAEEICEADIDTLQSLIHKSLLRRQGERFWMLETIRQYAAGQVEQHGEEEALADRHADYFIALAETAVRGAPDEDVEQGRRLYPELDNFRRALGWLAASGDVERELRLATSAFWCLWTRTSLREFHGSLASALGRAAGADAYLRAEALGAAALAAANLGEADVARAYARESLGLARKRDDKRQIEWALRVLSFDEPDLNERRRLLHECERLLRELGNDAGLGWVTFLRGMTFIDEGSFDPARETLEQAAALFSALGRRWEATNAEIAAGYALVAADRHAEARPILEAGLATAVEIASPGSIMEALVLLAAVRMEADAAAATRLLAAIRTIADETGRELDPRFEGRVLETNERRARERLGQRFEAEWEAGSGLTLEEAVALALGETGSSLPLAHKPPGTGRRTRRLKAT